MIRSVQQQIEECVRIWTSESGSRKKPWNKFATATEQM